MKPGVLFVNFGGPTCEAELEPFLRNLLGDVLPGPGWFARAMARRLAPLRAARVRDNYAGIGWSPLVPETLAQVQAVAATMGSDAPPMAAAMMFTQPTMAEGLSELLTQGVDRVLVVGLYPHWSFATAGSAYEMVHQALATLGRADLPVHYARAFFDHPTYAEGVAHTIQRASDGLGGTGPIHLLFSAHGVPVSFLRRGDPYADHVRASTRSIVDALGWTDPWHLSWQSRLGPVRWLTPDTPTTLRTLGQGGAKRLIIVPVSFVGEHIETLDEIDREYVELAHESGISHVGRAAALGLEPAFIDTLAQLVREGLDRFGTYHCSRCLLPQPETHRRQKQCPNCAFQFPGYLRDGTGGVG